MPDLKNPIFIRLTGSAIFIYLQSQFMDMIPLLLPHKKMKLVVIALIVAQLQVSAQLSQTIQPAPPSYLVTDSAPALVNGLQAGYTITGESEKEVGKKGNFSRYKIKFYITNTTNRPIMLPPGQWGGQPAGNSAPLLVRFACLNATGARLTSKECAISASPYTREEWVDGRDPHGNAIRIRKVLNLGYGIGPGATISTTNNIIMIVPLDQPPKVTASFPPSIGGYAAAAPATGQPTGEPGYTASASPYGTPSSHNGTPALQSVPSLIRLRNSSAGTYLNVPNGQIGCVGVDKNAPDCEWELSPVAGTKYFLIRNKLEQKFLSIENSGLLADNSQSQAAIWSIEQSFNSAGFRISNAVTNSVLALQNGTVQIVSSNTVQDNSACWFVERE